jgi:hypothetical protein
MLMNPSTEHLLLREVQSRLRNAIAHTVPRVGCDDEAELFQDGPVIALRLLNGTRRSRKNVTAANVAYYTVKYLRSGRRSTGYRKSDPLHPASQLNGRCRVHSFDEHVAVDRSTDESLTLGEILPARDDDPATQACRRLDWEELIQRLDVITKAILARRAASEELNGLVKRFGKSRSTIQKHKDRLGRLIKDVMGEDILVRVQEQPGWRNDVQALRERLNCRWERSAT